MSTVSGKQDEKAAHLSRVYFDVGGTTFWTRPVTLEKSSKLYAAYLERLRHTHRDGSVDGQSEKLPIRLDKDAEGFKHVLGYLRHPLYPFPPEFEYELQYYGVEYDGLFQDVDESDTDSYSSDGSVVTDIEDDDEDFDDDDDDIEDDEEDIEEGEEDLADLEDIEALEAELDRQSKAMSHVSKTSKTSKMSARQKEEAERGRSRERRPPPVSSSASQVSTSSKKK